MTAEVRALVEQSLREANSAGVAFTYRMRADMATTLLASLSASGWAVVPREITKEMWLRCPVEGTPEQLWNALIAAGEARE